MTQSHSDPALDNPALDNDDAATGDMVIKGFLEFVAETGGSYFGINNSRLATSYPQPLHHGDYIALFQDDNRRKAFVEGYLLIDHDRLLNDPAYTASEQRSYADKPFYFLVMNENEQAIQDYLTLHPRSPLRYEIQTENKLLSPQTTCALFAEEKAVILLRSRRAEQKRLDDIALTRQHMQQTPPDNLSL